jgi:hypothetical protein
MVNFCAAINNAKLTWNGFRVYAIDATKKNLPRSDELLDFFEAPHHAYFPQIITGVLFDVLAKVPLNYMRAPFKTPEREMALALLPFTAGGPGAAEPGLSQLSGVPGPYQARG